MYGRYTVYCRNLDVCIQLFIVNETPAKHFLEGLDHFNEKVTCHYFVSSDLVFNSVIELYLGSDIFEKSSYLESNIPLMYECLELWEDFLSEAIVLFSSVCRVHFLQ